MTSTSQLKSILDDSVHSDLYEEPAMEFLEDRGIYFYSHSRLYLIELAYRNGWRPSS